MDDFVVLVRGNSNEQLEYNAKELMHRLTSICNLKVLKVSYANFYTFSDDTCCARIQIFKWNNKSIKIDSEFKYLCFLNSKLNSFAHLRGCTLYITYMAGCKMIVTIQKQRNEFAFAIQIRKSLC